MFSRNVFKGNVARMDDGQISFGNESKMGGKLNFSESFDMEFYFNFIKLHISCHFK
jgi:hypothetical protein